MNRNNEIMNRIPSRTHRIEGGARTISVLLCKACQGLQYLNARYCKSSQCNAPARASIYRDLKAPMIQWLYEHGYCIAAVREKGTKPCHGCLGSGTDVAYGMKCHACNGTGVYSKPGYSEYVIGFRFVVEETMYGWHLPNSLIRFHFSLSGEAVQAIEGDEWTFCDVEYSVVQAKAVVRRFLNEASVLRAA